MLVPSSVTLERAAGYHFLSKRSCCLRCQFTLTNRGQHVPDKRNRSKRTGASPNKVVPLHEGAEVLRASLDDTDRAIVRALQANARATYTEIGRAAPRYDLANTVFSLGQDRAWRRAAARAAGLADGQSAVDVACGTGALTRELAASAPGAAVLGVDFSWEMVRRAAGAEPGAA